MLSQHSPLIVERQTAHLGGCLLFGISLAV